MVAVAGLLWVYFGVCFFVPGGILFFVRFFYFESTRPIASTRQPCFMYLSTRTAVRRGCHYLISLCLCVCVTFVVFTNCESCTRPITTNPGSMDAGQYALTRVTCFVARCLELVVVAGLLSISLCVLGAADFSGFFFFPDLFFLRSHTACCKYEAALPHLPLY